MEVASSDHKHRTENASEPRLHHLTHFHHETTSPSDQQMHARDFCGLYQCPSATPVAHHSRFSILFARKQSEFCSTSLHHAHCSHLTLLAIVIFNMITLLSLVGMIFTHDLSAQSRTRSRCPGVCSHGCPGHHYLLPDTCRLLRPPSVLVPCQEAAKREPCLLPLRLLPILPLMLLSLLQLHAATFSALIAEQDSTEYMLVVVSFSAPSVFLGTPLFVRIAGASSRSVRLSPTVPSVISLSVPVSSLSRGHASWSTHRGHAPPCLQNLQG